MLADARPYHAETFTVQNLAVAAIRSRIEPRETPASREGEEFKFYIGCAYRRMRRALVEPLKPPQTEHLLIKGG